MNKFLAVITFALAASVFAQDDDYEVMDTGNDESSATAQSEYSMGPYEPVATEVAQARNTDDTPLPAPKRPTYNFRSYGFGVSIWHNWEDSELNPKRDWDQGITLRYARIWEMTTNGAITLVDNAQFSFGDEFQWSDIFRIGGRYYFADKVLSPFIGAGVGLGFQLDYHYDDFDDVFSVGLAGGAELGVTIFRTSTTQLEIGGSYEFVLDKFDFGKESGYFSIYIAINY